MAKKNGTSRRDFLKTGAIGCGALAISQLDFARGILARAEAGELTAKELYELAQVENQLFTVCLNCNTGCGIKVKILDGVAAKIDGSPYSPWTLTPHLPMSEPLSRAAKVDGAICPKGQAGHQGAYDPYRIRKVLKRAGKRGEGKWQSIPFDQAIGEIVNGGKLFAQVPGEETREVAGLKALYALKDPKAFADMGADVAALRKKKMTVAEFKAKHAAHLDKLIDPDHPDFGPRNNQFVYMWGRKKGGRSDFSKRFYEAFGTANFHGHTTVCQGSLYFACKAMSEQYVGDTFKDGQKFYWQADLENSEYVVFVGSNLFDANYGPPNRTPRITQRLVDGKLKIAVLDPRFSKLASRAPGSWIPVKPGTDAAFAMGMTRWILENQRFDAKFLANANKAAAAADKESTWSNGAWLVKLGKDGTPGGFLRASEIGLKAKEVRKDKEGKEYDFEWLVVLKDGKPVAFDPNDEKEAVEGDLFVDAELPADKAGSIRVKSGLQLMKEAALEKTIAGYADLCGIEAKVIEEVAREFTSHGKKAAVDMHRGPAQHTNGFYNISALMSLNLLVGNFDWTGGMIAASTWNTDGSKTEKQPFPLKKLSPKVGKAFGLSIIRHDAKYEESTLFEAARYPAKRNWWPLSSDVYEEILPSIADAYPYPAKALFSYMAAPTYALPAGHTNIEALTDLERLPLYFASDITIGVTSMYADYLFPDLHYLERWEFHGSHPNMPVKVQPVRQPVIASPNEVVKVFGEEQPISYETVWLALAEKLGLPGFGKDGFGPGQDFCRPDDLYVRMVANIAFDGKEPVADAGAEDLRVFQASRRHLPKNVFDQGRWEKICGAAWAKVVTVLSRGGRFDTQEAAYKGDHVANKYGKLINLYQEKTAKAKDAFTGKPYFGAARYVPVVDTLGREPTALAEGFDLHLITQRDVRMTKSRTITHSYLTSSLPENAILVNGADARRLGLKTGSKVKVVSATNPEGVYDLKNGVKKPMVGVVQVTETIRPGIVTFTVGHGHWATGAADVTIDGKVVRGDPRRASGIHANAAMWIDPHLKNTCFIDKVGGSVSFYDTRVRLVPA
ncbi:MAG: molybdopterin-dependent oxidoreductase [Deltaproteobacteria bacterium]|nr:molybdopterin-dependent oxidoreductase [Deltaproteobacteria bacterium]